MRDNHLLHTHARMLCSFARMPSKETPVFLVICETPLYV